MLILHHMHLTSLITILYCWTNGRFLIRNRYDWFVNYKLVHDYWLTQVSHVKTDILEFWRFGHLWYSMCASWNNFSSLWHSVSIPQHSTLPQSTISYTWRPWVGMQSLDHSFDYLPKVSGLRSHVSHQHQLHTKKNFMWHIMPQIKKCTVCWNVLPSLRGHVIYVCGFSQKCFLTYLWRGFVRPKFIQTLHDLCSRSAGIQTAACKTLIGCDLVVEHWWFSWGFVRISENSVYKDFLQFLCQHYGEMQMRCKLE